MSDHESLDRQVVHGKRERGHRVINIAFLDVIPDHSWNITPHLKREVHLNWFEEILQMEASFMITGQRRWSNATPRQMMITNQAKFAVGKNAVAGLRNAIGRFGFCRVVHVHPRNKKNSPFSCIQDYCKR
jgi:hypothetical protein